MRLTPEAMAIAKIRLKLACCSSVEIIDIGIAPAVVLMADAGYYQDIYGNSDQYEQDNACNGFAYDSVQRGDDCDRKMIRATAEETMME